MIHRSVIYHWGIILTRAMYHNYRFATLAVFAQFALFAVDLECDKNYMRLLSLHERSFLIFIIKYLKILYLFRHLLASQVATLYTCTHVARYHHIRR